MAQAARKYEEDTNPNAAWTFSVGNYDVANNNGVLQGTIILSIDPSSPTHQLSVTGQWTPAGGSSSQTVATSWDGTTLTVSAPTPYSGRYKNNSTPTEFNSPGTNGCIIEYNNNDLWPTSYSQNGNGYSVTVSNNANANGTIDFYVDAGTNLSCIGSWSPSGNPNPSMAVQVTWKGGYLSWSVSNGGNYPDGVCQATAPKVIFRGGYDSAVPGQWTATQT